MSWYRTEISINLNADKDPLVFTLGQAFLILLLLVSLGVSYYFYSLYYTSQNKENQARKIVSAVAEIMILPSEELPTIATVKDLSVLAGQPFFANAETGDKVLLYADAKKAILYRPSVGKIVEVTIFAVPENIGTLGE